MEENGGLFQTAITNISCPIQNIALKINNLDNKNNVISNVIQIKTIGSQRHFKQYQKLFHHIAFGEKT